MTEEEYKKEKEFLKIFGCKKYCLQKRVSALYRAYHKGKLDEGFVQHLSESLESGELVMTKK